MHHPLPQTGSSDCAPVGKKGHLERNALVADPNLVAIPFVCDVLNIRLRGLASAPIVGLKARLFARAEVPQEKVRNVVRDYRCAPGGPLRAERVGSAVPLADRLYRRLGIRPAAEPAHRRMPATVEVERRSLRAYAEAVG